MKHTSLKKGGVTIFDRRRKLPTEEIMGAHNFTFVF